ncbi:ankyrin repeat domain-containing protein [Aliirhizobium terrae]|uniref:ankyrin repeat domain-containing protein n=1 Tax=Terrirhizobium terrae TaxID=2926709 RepID=UPI002575C0B5|nr:ankyrin repeat domain-containing protein [Rhizobium sp. CC-CFT758]WJH39392.1 ankyrin repeat domain-containing protein [Rhizobium sp. CC-CFT758]
MAKPKKKKTLPKDFEALLEAGDVAAVRAVFDTCDVNAYGGATKRTALAFNDLPDEVARWLVENGADISAPDSYGETPLHHRADRGDGGHGGASPAAIAARAIRPSQIRLPPVWCREKSDDRITDQMRDFVTRIGENFEFHRQGYNPESRDVASAALDRLYELFGVPPVPRRSMHDGKSPIVAKADTWQDRHQELWELLVPSSGAADTVQGEVIRISGRIARELDGNGGINWGDDYKRMADALLTHLGSAKSLPADDLKEATAIISEVKRKFGDTRRLCELSVEWVAQNPKPTTLPAPAYAI